MDRVVLVTGVSSPLATRVAETLSEESGVGRVIGADSSPPSEATADWYEYAPGRPADGALNYAHVDLHDGSLGRIASESGADLLLHLGLDTEHSPNREDNVLGTMRVLAVAQRSSTLRRLVVRSNATLDADDAAQVEQHTSVLQRRRPDISVAVLRFANLIGPSVESPLTRYLDLRVVPTVWGRDPWMRFLHEDDGAEALLRMAFSDESGHFDVAGQDAVPLSHCLRRVGGQRLPVPERGLKVLRRAAKHGRIDYASTSTARAGLSAEGSQTGSLEHALGWSPAYSSAQAFEDFADTRGRGAHRSDGPSARGGRLSPVHVLALARASLGR